MSHIVLLGDSIFDNSRYVPGGPEVVEQLRAQLPAGWRATLLARDGAVTDGVQAQLERLPADATHLVVSVGGNDALGHSGVVADTDRSLRDGLEELAEVRAEFRRQYRHMLVSVLARSRNVAVCTVYDAIPGFPSSALGALSYFNDVILRTAFEAGVPVIDLRLCCTQAGDYSAVSPIEPSRQGGAKIATWIVRVATSHDFSRQRTEVYGNSLDA